MGSTKCRSTEPNDPTNTWNSRVRVQNVSESRLVDEFARGNGERVPFRANKVTPRSAALPIRFANFACAWTKKYLARGRANEIIGP
jgi:hypothetical protein